MDISDHMSRRLHDTKLHKDFENKTKSKAEKREKQAVKNDLKRLDISDADIDNDDCFYDDLTNE